MTYRFAVLRLPGFGARVVDLGKGHTESSAWDAARAACTPSERVDWIAVTEDGARDFVAQLDARSRLNWGQA